MNRILIAFISAFVVGLTNGYVLPISKCRYDKPETVAINYTGLTALTDWNVIYVPDAEPFRDIDHHVVHLIPAEGSTIKKLITTVFKNGSRSSQDIRPTFANSRSQYVIEDTVDETGKFHHIHNYLLAITSDLGALYYSCSEDGDFQVDTRFIGIPKGRTLSEDGLKQLMDFDSKCNFTGNLVKVPYSHYSEV